MNLAVMLSRYSGTHRKTMAELTSRTTSSRNENRRARGPRFACYDLGNSARFAISFVHSSSLITTGEQLRDDTVLPSKKSNGRKYVRIPSNGRKSIWHFGSCNHDGSDQSQASVRSTRTTWNAKGR